jgi:hypothetical protein
VSNTTRLIVIWGGLIAIYLLVSHSKGATSVIGSFSNFATGTTKTLQGR